ncbi:hypothetical protein PGO11_24170, partial [Klebsiella aerogenes]
VGMVLAIKCHRQNMKTSIINGSEVSRLSVAIQSAEFQILRHSLLNRKKVRVPGGRGLMAYGRIDVQGIPDYSKCVVLR